ncbi:MAG: type IX secretion system sortase PorU, partial [Flavobacteriaceae bacterium]|nr:type IX secretion system sortase PorU [Flavobacteriaceae bacterium]
MKLLTFIFVLASVQFFAQTVAINWEEPKVLFPQQENAGKYPYFSNGNYALQEGVPTFSYSENTDFSGKINLTHLQWQAVSISQLGAIRQEDIPLEDSYFASVNSARGQKKLSVVIKTFKKVGNTYYQLNGFTIEKVSGTNLQAYSKTYKTTAFTSENVLSQGTWYKIKVSQTGVYKMDKNFLQKLGINTNGLNPKNIRIYGNGGGMLPEPTSDFRYGNLQENAIQVIGEEDGVFNDGDYVLFYAQGSDFWDRRNAGAIKNIIRHKKNIYEDYAYYFLTVDKGEGKRTISTTYAEPDAKKYTEYDDFQFFEEDKNNLNQQGRLWVGDNMGLKNTQEISFPVHDLVNGSTVTWQFYWVANYALNGKVNISYNAANINATNLTSSNFFVLGNASGTISASEGKLDFSVNFDNSANPVGELYPDYFEVLYKQKLSFNGKQMNFRTFDTVEDGKIYGFDFSGTAPEQVWDVSDPTGARSLEKKSTANSYSYQFSSSDFKNELVAFNAASAYVPETVGRISNQSLHSLSNVDYVIVTVPEFLSEANRLKQYHQSVNNLNVEVVTTAQIYNEFSSGSQDLVGIRDFFRYLYQKDGKLKYALLLGSGSYDFKNKLKQGYNLIPSYQSYNGAGYGSSFVSDDFLAMLDEDEAKTDGFYDADLTSSQLDIAVGRMIAKNISEARLCVDKSVKYDNGTSSQGTPFGDWRLKAALVVDYDVGPPVFHEEMDATIGAFFQNSLPQFALRKLYIDAFKADYTSGGVRYPQVNEAIRNAVDNGALVINYLGHGGPTSFSQSRVFTADDIKNMSNLNRDYTRLPLFITVSCDISIWDNPILNSLGDQLYLKDAGGAGAMITTTREIGIFFALKMNPIIIENLFVLSGNKYQPMGEALRQSKLQYVSPDNRKVSLLGDPAQSLSHPPRNIVLTKINGIDAASFDGTFRALDFVTLEGNVLNVSNAVDNTFNGTVQATLYDKPVQKTTLNNPGYLPYMDYTEQVNAVYKGSATVKNGNFKIEFYVPKDINYQVGDGKLVL